MGIGEEVMGTCALYERRLIEVEQDFVNLVKNLFLLLLYIDKTDVPGP